MLRDSRSVYDRRKRDPEFRAKWDEAIGESYAMLELEMLARGRRGEDRAAPKSDAERRLRELPTAGAEPVAHAPEPEQGPGSLGAAADARRENARRSGEEAGRDQPPARRDRMRDGAAPKFALLERGRAGQALSLAERVALPPPNERRRLLARARARRLAEFVGRWLIWARPGQCRRAATGAPG